MNKEELFINACNAGRWKWRAWRISLFSPTLLTESNQKEFEPYDIDYRSDGIYYYSEANKWEKVEGVDVTDGAFNGLYQANEPLSLNLGDVPNLTEPTESTYGRALYNHMVVSYAFGKKIPYVQKVMPTDIEKMFIDHFVDEPDDGHDLKDDEYYPSEVERFVKALFELTSLCQYITPTGSIKTLTTHPEMIKTRNMLLEKYKDHLDDPAYVTMIQNELVALDKEWLKGDNAEGYYSSGKDFSVKRKKMFVMHGIEAAFRDDGGYDLIPTSLSEGWDMSKLVAKYNAVRQGSYDRGSDTALGGEKVTFLQRIAQNILVQPGDCGTPLRYHTVLTKDSVKRYETMNMEVDGKLMPINAETTKSLMGKEVAIRRPILCKQSHADFCSACVGGLFSKNDRSIANEIPIVGTRIMLAFMKSMHGVELSVAHYDYTKHLN